MIQVDGWVSWLKVFFDDSAEIPTILFPFFVLFHQAMVTADWWELSTSLVYKHDGI